MRLGFIFILILSGCSKADQDKAFNRDDHDDTPTAIVQSLASVWSSSEAIFDLREVRNGYTRPVTIEFADGLVCQHQARLESSVPDLHIGQITLLSGDCDGLINEEIKYVHDGNSLEICWWGINGCHTFY